MPVFLVCIGVSRGEYRDASPAEIDLFCHHVLVLFYFFEKCLECFFVGGPVVFSLSRVSCASEIKERKRKRSQEGQDSSCQG